MVSKMIRDEKLKLTFRKNLNSYRQTIAILDDVYFSKPFREDVDIYMTVTVLHTDVYGVRRIADRG